MSPRPLAALAGSGDHELFRRRTREFNEVMSIFAHVRGKGVTMGATRVQALVLLLITLPLSEWNAFGQNSQDEAKKVTVAAVQSKSSTITQRFLCRINSHRHIEVRTPAEGHLAAISVKDGQAVKRGDLLFQVGPPMDKEKPDAENRDKAVFIKAPFDGLIGRLPRQLGSFVLKGETLTTLSDNSVMWVYFNVPEKYYLEYMATRKQHEKEDKIELVLANGNTFPQTGLIGAIEAEFNTNTGGIAFRADFPNPEGLLRHGQTGTVLINRVLKDAIVIPQRATFQILDKQYVYVVDKDHVAHQRGIVIQNETEDLFVIEKGVDAGDRIIVDGVRLVRDGDKVE
jgi:membrane fusion protein (multidrug efflux system)